MDRILLEVCIASVEDALAAQTGGADRLELNAGLSLGGLTPSLGTLAEVKLAVALPVMVMLRPRPGGFCYSESDFNVMCRDGDFALEQRADGIVFGVLNEKGGIDEPRCRALIRRCDGCPVIFHRAFDVTPDPFLALEQLIDLGFTRVMSSGQEENALSGAALLKQLIERAAGRIEILPACGINPRAVAEVVARTGCNQVHASLRQFRPDGSTSARPLVRFGSTTLPREDGFEGTDEGMVRMMRRLLDG